VKPQSIAAIILIVAGIAALAYQGFTYRTQDETIDLGPVTITTERSRTIPLPPVVGAVAIAGGIILFFLNRKQS